MIRDFLRSVCDVIDRHGRADCETNVRSAGDLRLLLAEIQELKSLLLKLPPSSQHPHAKPTPPKKKSNRKRGGQPGHRRHLRVLIPSAECSAVIPVRTSVCSGCGERLRGNDRGPRRHQVWELPEIKPVVTEYQQYRLACPGCGKTTCATLSAGVPRGQSGLNLVAFTGLLMRHFRQSKRRAALFLQDLLKFLCCPALTVKMQDQVAAALKSPYDELQQELAKQPQVFLDESPTNQANQKAWLWMAVTKLFAVFAIFSSRKGDALPELLGDDYGGIINCDRAKMYWRAERLQWCWAHFKRDIQALIDHPDHQIKRLGHDLMRQVKLMFLHWRAYKPTSRATSTGQPFAR